MTPQRELTKEELRNQYSGGTGFTWYVFPVCHGETAYPSMKYVDWLESRLALADKEIERLTRRERDVDDILAGR